MRSGTENRSAAVGVSRQSGRLELDEPDNEGDIVWAAFRDLVARASSAST